MLRILYFFLVALDFIITKNNILTVLIPHNQRPQFILFSPLYQTGLLNHLPRSRLKA